MSRQSNSRERREGLGNPATAHKLGVCYGDDDRRGTCIQIGTGGIEFTWSVWPDLTRPHPCDLSWVHRATTGASTQFMDGHAQQATPSAPGLC